MHECIKNKGRKKKKKPCLVGCLGDFPWRLGRRCGRVRTEGTLLSQNGRRIRRRRRRMIGLEPEHVLAWTKRWRSTTCRRRNRRRNKVRSKQFRFQQPRIGLITPFLPRRRLLHEPECVKPRRGPAGNEPVTACGVRFRRRAREVRDWTKRRRRREVGTERRWRWCCRVEAQRGSRHPSWEVQTGFPRPRGLHFLFQLKNFFVEKVNEGRKLCFVCRGRRR